MIRHAAALLALAALAACAGGADAADSPRTQLMSGVHPYEIQCRDGLVLALRGTDGSPACLTLQTWTVLSERGWILVKAPGVAGIAPPAGATDAVQDAPPGIPAEPTDAADAPPPAGATDAVQDAPPGIPADLVADSNDCAARYYSQLSSERHGRNTVFSPIGAYVAFSALYEGAGHSYHPLNPDLVHANICIEPDDAERRKDVAHAAEYLGRDKDGSFMRVPSLLWAKASGMPDGGHLYFPNKPTLDILHEFYPVDTYVKRYSETRIISDVGPGLQPGIPSGYYMNTFAYPDMDAPLFAGASRRGVNPYLDAQNDWLQRVTDGGMPWVPSWGSIQAAHPDARLLFNVAYFEGRWETPFYGLPHEQQFWSGEHSVNPDWMTVDGTFGYALLQDLSLVSMPYRGDRFSMLVAIPHERGGLEDLQAGLTAGTVDQWRQKLAPHRVEIEMPRFEISMHYSLANVMHNLANLDGFTLQARDIPDSESFLPARASDIAYSSQEAHIRVDEGGANAARAAPRHAESAAGTSGTDVYFRMAHPFLFLILDDASGAILMMGSVHDPTSSDWEAFYQGPHSYRLDHRAWTSVPNFHYDETTFARHWPDPPPVSD